MTLLPTASWLTPPQSTWIRVASGLAALAAAGLGALDVLDGAAGWPRLFALLLTMPSAAVLIVIGAESDRRSVALTAVGLPLLVVSAVLADGGYAQAWWLAGAAVWAMGAGIVAWGRWPAFAVFSAILAAVCLIGAAVTAVGLGPPIASVTAVRSALTVAWTAWLGAVLLLDRALWAQEVAWPERMESFHG